MTTRDRLPASTPDAHASYSGEADFRERLAARLQLGECEFPLIGSDYDLNPLSAPTRPRTLRPAAVLALMIDRPAGLHFLFTTRAADMPTHAGQIAFPGGGRRPEDASLAAAALREAQEEIGLAPERVRVLGGYGAFETVSGFRVTPFVAIAPPDLVLRPDPREVADIFEAPASFLMNPANHQIHSREWRGEARHYYAMPYGDRYIWGATARMLKGLFDRLYGAPRR